MSDDPLLTDLQETARMMGLDSAGTADELRARITGRSDEATGRARKTRPSRQTRKPKSPPQNGGSAADTETTSEIPQVPRKRIGAERRLMEALTGTYFSAGMALQGIGALQTLRSPAPIDTPPPAMRLGLVLMDEETVDRAVTAWMEVADQNPKVKKALIRAMEGTAIATLVGIHLSIILQAGLLPGVSPVIANAQYNGGSAPSH